MTAIALSVAEQQALWALRQADESWLELWQLARRMGYGSRRASRDPVVDLRRRGLVVKRPAERGCSRVEVSLARSGIG